ncbi:MAG: type II toxin-antitoxin system VapC family toxin [Candidatus Hodarchaeota archaeon]
MILTDTTFLIDCLRKKADVQAIIDNYPDEILYTTEINVFEMYLGLYSSKFLKSKKELFEQRKKRLEDLLTKFQVLSFARKEAIEAAKILGKLSIEGQLIDFRDGMIGGIARINGISTILTKNVEHFKRIESLNVISY